ncbi:unnamed protein product [Periconia digitata]|uniref:Protein arginine methyltransferase NDUFAF7 n=1 Tax=Periconia digitata TaxID=1303443 RepID=A0A9W4UST1_9PLEO|nr:unnamed protein product [Periconia digitata]
MKANSLRIVRNTVRYTVPRPSVPRCVPYGQRWSSTGTREWSTPLAKQLAEAINTTGPISVAAYMRQCLTSDMGGYYTRETSGHDQFGTKGDFITSPEISQVFGELVGIWLYTEWIGQGKNEKVHIVEVGPGRGTLMSDVLRTISSFKSFANRVQTIYMVEASEQLRKQQAQLLSGTEELKETELGWTAPCKHIPGCDIIWCEDIRFVPKDETSTPFILAHEFFDALPIHVFQNVANSSLPAASTTVTPDGPLVPKHGPQVPKNNWHELVVSPLPPPSSDTTSPSSKDPPPEFHLTVSKSPTPHSLYLPQLSNRYKNLQNTSDAIIEISPESLSYISDFAVRIGGDNPPSSTNAATAAKTHSIYTPNASAQSAATPFQKSTPSGAALILDYGPATTIPTNTLRGIRAHQPVSPFVAPGLVDLSADVDFVGLAEAALHASSGIEIHGPVEQGFFLGSLGIQERVERLVKSAEKTADGDEVRKRLETSRNRLIDRGPTGMGRIYKAMAILPYFEQKKVRRPVGFGGSFFG